MAQNEGPEESTAVKRCFQYAEDVLEGRIRTCEKTRMACRRFLDDLEKSRTDPDYPWRFASMKHCQPISSIRS